MFESHRFRFKMKKPLQLPIIFLTIISGIQNGYPVPGRTNYPLLLNRNNKPKPAFNAVLLIPPVQN